MKTLSLSRQGLPRVAHRFNGGRAPGRNDESRQGRQNRAIIVLTSGRRGATRRASVAPVGAADRERIRGPTDESVGYCRVSLPGQRGIGNSGECRLRVDIRSVLLLGSRTLKGRHRDAPRGIVAPFQGWGDLGTDDPGRRSLRSLCPGLSCGCPCGAKRAAASEKRSGTADEHG